MPYIETNLENIINIKRNLIVHSSEPAVYAYSFGEETHNFWEFEYVTKGTFGIYHGDTAYILNEGDILFHKPNQPHETFSVDPDTVIGFANISFVCNSAAMSVFEDYHGQLSPKSKILVEDLIEEGTNTFDAVADGPIARSVVKPTAPPGGQQAYKNKLELFLINLLREINEQNPDKFFSNKKDYDKKLYADIIKYLSDNIYSSVSLDDMCSKFNYSKAFLCKFFKNKSGVTIINYYNELKIREASELLKDKGNTVSKVSETLNFTSRYYFAKSFKKVMGVSPSEYQKTL